MSATQSQWVNTVRLETAHTTVVTWLVMYWSGVQIGLLGDIMKQLGSIVKIHKDRVVEIKGYYVEVDGRATTFAATCAALAVVPIILNLEVIR